ncbi:hypothetical protein Rhopal_005028-T1 [Rhodotorula paludigena]|uniref:Uncharacterized protein n=1 Tax=Rhodotorula paludigena TaxID=86838 RepID=A0AAV5GHA9_9BASI|nr:hypothetical protein Rhopal_005028-T1 [Rhodotorula paludigena]
MFSRLFGWASTSDAAGGSSRGAGGQDASSSSPRDPSSSSSALHDGAQRPEDAARTARNRKKRQQKKAARARHRADAPEGGEPDDDLVFDGADDEADDDGFGEADDDLSYLERIGGLRQQREEQLRAQAMAQAGQGSPAGAGSAGGAGGAGGMQRLAKPGEGELNTTGYVAGPEDVAAADLIEEMLRQGKVRPGAAAGPLNRISGLPEGAGQVGGIKVPSSHEVRRRAKESGLIPFTDDEGNLRVGVRIKPDIVLMHPKEGKGEPILLRM